jgi:putative peptidoglycan lipid II flippase
MVNAGWLLIGLRRRGHYRPAPGWRGFIARLLPANVALGGGLWFASIQLDWLALQAHPGLRVAWLSGVMVVAVLGYFGLLALAGVNMRQFARRG